MALLSKDQIFNAVDRKYEVVHVPQWNGDVRLRSLTGRERDEFEASNYSVKGGKTKENFVNFRARLVAMSVVDEDGNQIFKTRAEISMLGNKSAASLQLLFDKAQEMNGLSDEDVEDLTEDFDREGDAVSTFA